MEAVKEEPTIKTEPTINTESTTSDLATRTSEMIDSAKKVVGDVVSGVTAKAGDVVSGVTSKASDVVSGVTSKAGDVVSGVTAKASDALESAKQTISPSDLETETISGDSLLAAENQMAQLNIKHASEAVKDIKSEVKDEGDFKLGKPFTILWSG